MTPELASAQAGCASLPAPSGFVVDVTPAQAGQLQSIIDAALPGDTIRLSDGLYSPSQTLMLRTAGVTLRSKSGNRNGVVIDGRYAVNDLILIQRSDVTIADLTLMRSSWHLVHVAPDGSTLTGTTLHNLRAVDGSEQFVKVNPAGGQYADNGVIRCSSLELTDVGRTYVRNNCYTGGIDIHQARGWQIYANIVSGFWCASGLSEHAIHAWTGSRDTVVDRNTIVNSARGIGLGLGSSGSGRTYGDSPCSGAAYVGHYGGAITNNMVVANDPRLFASGYGFDTGIGLEQSCETNVLHNTVASTQHPRSSSIEWRFANTVAAVANNLVTHTLVARDGARAVLGGNVANAPLSLFVNVPGANLRLVPAATIAIDKAAPLATPVSRDIDGEIRGTAADVGADEYMAAAPAPPSTSKATAVSLRADRVAPQPATTLVTWTATPTGGVAPHQYQWWVYNGSTWAAVTSWTTANTYTWQPATPHDYYRVAVWVRSDGSTGGAETSTEIPFPISGVVGAPAPPPPPPPTATATAVQLKTNLPSPQPPNTAVTWTAVPTGGVAPHRYQWWVYNGSTWAAVTTWTTANTYTWQPATPHDYYRVAVWVRSDGSTGGPEASTEIPFPISGVVGAPAPPPPPPPTATATAVQLNTNLPSPQPPNTAITWTAVPTGGVAPHQYQWWIFNGSTWLAATPWTTANRYTWQPTAANANFRVAVWVRSAGSTGGYETSVEKWFAITGTAVAAPQTPTPPTPGARATAVRITSNVAEPQPVNTAVIWTASVTGGVAPYQYQWWTFNGSTWTSTPWTASNTFTWRPTVASTSSRVAVWVRSAGNTTDHETATESWFRIVQ